MHAVETNLGLATDLMLHAQMGVVESRDRYIVVRTPDVPEYFFGNMLVLDQRPTERALMRLEADFASYIGVPPRIAHRTFTWAESEAGSVDLSGFVKHGYDATMCRVLCAHPQEIQPIELKRDIEVRPLSSQDDWDVWAELHLADMANPRALTSQRFIAFQQRAYQTLVERGLGNGWGAFVGNKQVANLGLFFLEGVGRFQSVITAPQYRNKGICKSLVSEVVRRAARDAEQLVMVADEDYFAGNLYEALGFRRQGRVGSLCREPSESMQSNESFRTD